tara:strand:+ start:712 stop:1047 length:336 start_codon:yes stop_codon:yes gene_type:complete
MTTSPVRFVPEHYCQFSDLLLGDFYTECHPMPGSSSCFNREDRDQTYVDASNILDKYILEIGDAVGMSDDVEDEPTIDQRIAAFDLICQFAGSPTSMERLESGHIKFKDLI